MKIADVQIGTEYAYVSWVRRGETTYEVIARSAGKFTRVRVLEKLHGGKVRLEEWDVTGGQWVPMAPGFHGHPSSTSLLCTHDEAVALRRQVAHDQQRQREASMARLAREQEALREIAPLIAGFEGDLGYTLPGAITLAVTGDDGRTEASPYARYNHTDKVTLSVVTLRDLLAHVAKGA